MSIWNKIKQFKETYRAEIIVTGLTASAITVMLITSYLYYKQGIREGAQAGFMAGYYSALKTSDKMFPQIKLLELWTNWISEHPGESIDVIL